MDVAPLIFLIQSITTLWRSWFDSISTFHSYKWVNYD